MPKKKGIWKSTSSDFTLNNPANAPKPRKSYPADAGVNTWNEISTDFNIVEEINADGFKQFVSKKKNNGAKTDHDIANRPGIEYPEILFYLISAYIEPEEIASFARVNKAAYACTKRETFWHNLYKTYCHNHPRLPQRLRIGNSLVYGLRQSVIRALHHTYDPFVWKIGQEALQDSQPHELLRRRCVNVWYCRGPLYWLWFFKFKKRQLQKPEVVDNMNKELGRIDANSEEDCQVLQVTCQIFRDIPPVMGMTLTSVSALLTEGFRCQKLHLGFSTTRPNISRDTIPELPVVFDTVVNIFVFDWWHPKYSDNKLPYRNGTWSPVRRSDFLK